MSFLYAVLSRFHSCLKLAKIRFVPKLCSKLHVCIVNDILSFFAPKIWGGVTSQRPCGTGVHKCRQFPVCVLNFNKIRCRTAEIRLAEKNLKNHTDSII